MMTVQGMSACWFLRGRGRRMLSVLVGLGMGIGAGGAGADVQVSVSAACNIYGAGHAVPPEPSGLGGGFLPVLVDIPAGACAVEVVQVEGTIRFGCAGCENGPDGQTLGAVCGVGSFGGISGFRSLRARHFSGVFLGPGEPADPAPANLETPAFDFGTLAPLLAQQFYIGDGLTGTGSGNVQRFVLPAGATRLFLGFADSAGECDSPPGGYFNNTGGVEGVVRFVIAADFNRDAAVNSQDFFDFLGAFFSNAPEADFNGDGAVTSQDFFDFLNAFFGGCA